MRFCFALRAAERTPAKLAPPLRASTAVVRARGPFPFLRADFGVAVTDLIFRGAIWGCQPALPMGKPRIRVCFLVLAAELDEWRSFSRLRGT